MGFSYSILQIVQFCVLSSASLEKMLRPTGPTLNFPVELPEMFSALTKVRPVRSDVQGPDGDTRENGPKNDQQLTNDSLTLADVETNLMSEHELNPLLVDPEMSEFDFQNSVREPYFVDLTDSRLSDHSSDDINGQHSTEVSHAPDTAISSTNGVINQQKGTREKSPENEFSSKRKPELSASPTSKKIKPNVTTTTSADIDDDVAVVEPEVLPNASVAITVEKKDSISAPENDLEEEMLSSFVDVID